MLDDLKGGLLLLHLLLDEPLEQHVRRVVLLSLGLPVEVLNHRGHFSLVLKGVFHDRLHRLELGRGLSDALHDDTAIPVVYVAEEPHGVGDFFLVLDFHPVRKPVQVLRLEVGGHRQV